MWGGRGLLLCLITAACFYGNAAQTTVCTQEAVADIVFLVDGSWSIGNENFEQIRQFLITLVDNLDVGPSHVRVGLVQYSNQPRTEFQLNTFQSKSAILQYVRTLPYMGGGTYTGEGLSFLLKEHFVPVAGSRADQQVAQIAVVITDGKSQDDVKLNAEAMKKRGITVYAIGIKDADEAQLREIASTPHGQYVRSVSDFDALQGISQSILQTLCTTVEEAQRQLQQLSQECARATVADIVFLVDGSSSIGLSNFDEMKQFLRNVISGLDIGPNKVRVGLAQYSDEPHEEFLLKDHMDSKSLLEQVEKLALRTGGTETGKAIDFVRLRYFTKEAGSRAKQRVPQIVVVITDGESMDAVEGPAQQLRQQGIIVFGIGVGQFNLEQLRSIANQPSQRFMFTISNYQALQSLTDGLLQKVCVSMDDQRQALAEKFADIVFLVDGGISVGDFQQVRNILFRLVNQLNFGASAYRLGLAQYTQDIKVEFLLKDHQTKEDIQNTLRNFRHLRPSAAVKRNLGAALKLTHSEFFTKEAGSRADQGYRQYLVVLSGKDSDDSIDKQSRVIKSAGITVVGMSLGMSMQDLRVISSRGFAFESITNASPILREIFLKEEVEAVLTSDCKAAKLADIVFIVDESGSIGTDHFQLVRTFLHSIISGLEISPKKVRVGIVMYNDSPRAQVYLDTFKNKNNLLNFIKILPYTGGGTRTGDALKFAREKVFIKEKGSRKDKGVQQVAVVITDGESQDNVSQPAANLRRAGVTVYSVGVQNANKLELKQMASHPPNKHVFIVDNFAKLKSLEKSLQKVICNNIIHQSFTVINRRAGIKEGCAQKDEADIFFLIDHSGSIHPSDFQDMKKFIMEFLRTFRIGPEYVRLGVAKYADSPNLEFDLTTYSDAKTLEKAVERIQQIGGGTETGRALAFMKQHFDQAAITRGHKVSEYLVVITDGKSSDEVKIPAEDLRKQGITIYAIGVKNADMNELLEISGDPKNTFFVNNFDALRPIKDNIITDMCSPDVCKDIPGDLIFLIDSSGSIDPADYMKMKDFMKSVIGKSFIGKNDVHVGVMQFSTKQKPEFQLNSYFSKEEMWKSIDDMRQLGGGTLTGRAITEVSQYFISAYGGRPDLQQRLVVITDGEAQDEVKRPAEALRANGVLLYAIGVVDANRTQLLEISGSPDRMYVERDFDALKDLESHVSLDLCDPDRECKKTERADIIFLVDSSKSITQEKFRSMQKFMQSMVNQTTVGKDLTRFGIILYSTDHKSIFTLNQYTSRQQVSEEIDKLSLLLEDTYTGEALAYSLQFFGAEHGGRAELQVPQILMVITDGDATDPNKLAPSSKALRDKGVTVISIGVEGADEAQLEIMAGQDKSKVFYVADFKALEGLYRNITQVLCNSTKPACEKKQADLVFLLDQSGSIQPDDYSRMKSFTTDLVKSFQVGADLVRVAVAQFSSTFKHEFYLNQFSSEDAVSAHILGMRQDGGGTLIGAALDSIREFFEASRGGRRGADVSQNLVLITDGDSQDEVVEQADRLRALGIEIFAIGIGKVHDFQLLQITRERERLFTVANFGSLQKIREKVVRTICTSKPIEEKSDCTIDIAMGFDISQRTGVPGEVLVSGHSKLQSFLPQIAHYVSTVPGLCCVKPVSTKLGYRLVGRDGRMLYDFNFEEYSEEVLAKVMTTSLAQATYFNSAMLKSFQEKFKTQSGAGVKVLLIFSDGLDEDVMSLEQESEKLRKSGVSALLTVALEGVRDAAQLQMVEFGRGFGYKLPLSIGMQSVGSTILKQIDTVSDRECCKVMCKCSGHEGLRGSRGQQGTKGFLGQKGHPGFPGEQGISGERGPPGPSGPPGIQGCPGPRGQKGFRGLRGDRGEDGEDGLDGIDGEQGATGRDGSAGERGHPGNPGIPGISGEVGQPGQRGLRGDPGEPGRENRSPGPKGEAGNPGLPGPAGPEGRPAESGVIGNPGPAGRRGPLGEKGSPGEPGAAGLQGIPGASGPQGPRGVGGQPGPIGTPGLPGAQGSPGQPGSPGLTGRRGATGPKGQPGDPGIKGGPGPAGPRGMPGQDGRDGYGPDGPKGNKGDPGFHGYPGVTGESGQPGPKGLPGRKGNRGRGGNSGLSGESGITGEPGYPGHRGRRGPPGKKGMTDCELITYIRDNCACSFGHSQCPAFPTELVFGLDMSDDVTPVLFERQRTALLSLLEDISIVESNCPTGARVAVVGFSTYTKYLIRFQDYRRKSQLIEAVKNIALERTSNKRQLGATMRFVGQNIFKRVRAGLLMRKVAVFFSNGPSQEVDDIVTAIMEYRALNIVPAVISLKNADAISRALQVDDSGRSIFTVLGRPQTLAADLSKVRNCTICYDPCRRSEQCSFIQEQQQPQQVDVDLAMVLDGSREMQADQYTGAQQLLGSVVEHIAVSPQPQRVRNQARVALVQQGAGQTAKLEFGLQTYQNQELMRRHLFQSMQQQGGSSVLGRTLDYTLKEVLTGRSRRKVLLTVVATQTAFMDRARLRYVSQKAKCDGVALFVVAVGDRYNRTQVEELASLPVQQHLVHVSKLEAEDQDYVQRFFRVFLSALNKGMNTYPHASSQRTCDQRILQEEPIFNTQQGVGDVEEVYREEEGYQEQTGGQTQTSQLDVIESLIRGDMQGFVTGVNSNALCQLDSDIGIACADYVQVWFFDRSIGACSPFWYGGCGGNANRFNTEHECLQTCGINRPGVMQQTEQSSFPSKDVCFQRNDPGSCQNYTMMWFFDTEQSECSRFWYGGCGGNQNRFTTQAECENLCLTKSR